MSFQKFYRVQPNTALISESTRFYLGVRERDVTCASALPADLGTMATRGARGARSQPGAHFREGGGSTVPPTAGGRADPPDGTRPNDRVAGSPLPISPGGYGRAAPCPLPTAGAPAGRPVHGARFLSQSATPPPPHPATPRALRCAERRATRGRHVPCPPRPPSRTEGKASTNPRAGSPVRPPPAELQAESSTQRRIPFSSGTAMVP